MHTWALFSCSSLITLTAYNLSQLPKGQEAGPEPEPDASEKFAEADKFSLETVSSMFPEFEPAVELPPLPTQPQLSKLDELSGYNPAIYDPDQYPVKEIDLLGALPESSVALSLPEPVVTYRAEAVNPLPSAIPAPLPTPLPARTAATPRPTAQPQLEQSAAAPTFAQRNAADALAQVPTTANDAPAAPRQNAAATGDAIAFASPIESPELFGTLPEVTAPVRPAAPSTAVTEAHESATIAAAQSPTADLSMAELFDVDSIGVLEAAPDSAISMELSMTRQDLIQRYCDRAPTERSESTSLAVCADDTNELAQRIPEAVTAGTPIPGSVESPTRSNPAIGVE